MSYQADLNNIEAKTGRAPEEFIQLAHDKGFDASSDPAQIAIWLSEDFQLGHDHAVALVQLITHGAQISDRHVGSAGPHREETDLPSFEARSE